MVIITDNENKIVHILRHRGNTVVRSGFHVYHDALIYMEDIDKGDIKIGDVYQPKEDSETFWKEQ